MVLGCGRSNRSGGSEPLPIFASRRDLGVDSSALSDEEAEARFREFKTVDPFPDVPPALLNSAHVGDYMRTVALVWPYDLKRRKAASYAMRVGRNVAYYDPGNPSADPYRELDEDEEFLLPPNSLIYVRTKERFQLPDYIAARFNLHIDLVHKGLLLGTGPVVDPGFIGHLVVPLHNLTRNTYVMRADQELIWAEFTKTSLLPQWREGGLSLEGGAPLSDHKPFDKAKSNHEMAYYISKATKAAGPNRATADFPTNSIPERMIESQQAVLEARHDAQIAKQEAETARKSVTTLRNFGIGASIVLIIGLITLFVAMFQLVNATQSMVRDERGRAASQRIRQTEIDRAVLRAEVLLLEACEPVTPAAGTALRRRMVQARISANELARRDGTPAPFPEGEAIKATTCPK